jgi:hypothetical protein
MLVKDKKSSIIDAGLDMTRAPSRVRSEAEDNPAGGLAAGRALAATWREQLGEGDAGAGRRGVDEWVG